MSERLSEDDFEDDTLKLAKAVCSVMTLETLFREWTSFSWDISQ